jgi:inhibitor of cysteine peptidase
VVIAMPVKTLVKIIALAAVFLIHAASAYSECKQKQVSSPMKVIVETDNGSSIGIHPGEQVRIVLPENASSGYRWAIDRYTEEFIEIVSTEPHYKPGALGSGGEVEYIIKGRKIGSGEISLKQWRHWEGNSSVINRFQLQVDVQP